MLRKHINKATEEITRDETHANTKFTKSQLRIALKVMAKRSDSILDLRPDFEDPYLPEDVFMIILEYYERYGGSLVNFFSMRLID
jgi:hypothetical protein